MWKEESQDLECDLWEAEDFGGVWVVALVTVHRPDSLSWLKFKKGKIWVWQRRWPGGLVFTSGGTKADISFYSYLFRICESIHCFQNIHCHALHFLSESEGDPMHCSWCVSYRVLLMTSHSRRTHLDIFCKLYFALGFLQKITKQFSTFFSHTFTADNSLFPQFQKDFPLGFHCYVFTINVVHHIRHSHFSLH